jgi:hypothetical protein
MANKKNKNGAFNMNKSAFTLILFLTISILNLANAQSQPNFNIIDGSNFLINTPDFQVNKNSDTTGTSADNASIAIDGSGNFIITWEDFDARNADHDIYAQCYSSDGSVLGTNFKVNNDQGSTYQENPSIAADDSGNFIITWEDNRNGIYAYDIYAQRYSSDGSLLGTNFKVNDDQGSASQNYPSIAADGNGNFIITWYDGRNGNSDIYAQRYSSDGSVLGTNFKVNDDQGSASQYYPSIAADGNGNFIITWWDSRADIYAQRYSSDGSALGTNFTVPDQGSAYPKEPSIAADSSGNFIITWEDMRNGDYDIYAQRYSSDGSALDTNFKVNDQASLMQFDKKPSIAADGSGNFIITWEDQRNGRSYPENIYAQRYSCDGDTIGSNLRITGTNESIQVYPDVILWNGCIYSTWSDNRSGRYDIWANVLDWENPNPSYITKVEKPQPASSFVLHQNYPNPFNPSTSIEFMLIKPEKVTLEVFNIQGVTVQTLLNREMSKGFHQIQFRAENLPTGIYFYRLSTGEFKTMKKMMLLK